jgi:hypothetical protein
MLGRGHVNDLPLATSECGSSEQFPSDGWVIVSMHDVRWISACCTR